MADSFGNKSPELREETKLTRKESMQQYEELNLAYELLCKKDSEINLLKRRLRQKELQSHVDSEKQNELEGKILNQQQVIDILQQELIIVNALHEQCCQKTGPLQCSPLKTQDSPPQFGPTIGNATLAKHSENDDRANNKMGTAAEQLQIILDQMKNSSMP